MPRNEDTQLGTSQCLEQNFSWRDAHLFTIPDKEVKKDQSTDTTEVQLGVRVLHFPHFTTGSRFQFKSKQVLFQQRPINQHHPEIREEEGNTYEAWSSPHSITSQWPKKDSFCTPETGLELPSGPKDRKLKLQIIKHILMYHCLFNQSCFRWINWNSSGYA